MLRLILIISCLVIPTQSMAMTLQWSTGTAAIAFSTATRCTLIINGAPATSLPNGWRLVWVTQDCTIDPIPSEQECLAGSTSIFNVLAPSTPFELASGERTAQFCEPDSGTPTRALVVFDLPPQARGKLKAIALDPADLDSMQVIESNIATFNGGVEGSFPPAILRTTTQHQSTTFNLSAVGTDLEAAASLSLAAHDGSWSAGLQIDEVEPNLLSATGSFASSVPACVLLVSGEDGIGAALVESDPPPPPLDPQAGCQQQFIEDIYPPYTIQAKDFAFVPGGWTPEGVWKFHLFYIRQNQFMSFANNSKNLGHAVSNDLNQWTVLDTAAISVRPGQFDSQHVWAPTIVKRGLTYTMFYTGVDDAQDQRIGFATSSDLINWVQGTTVLSASQVAWADANPPSPYNGQQQFRDPYVMPHPTQPGQWLMYFVTTPTAYSPGMVVGVARSTGNFSAWTDAAPLWATLRPSTRAESPHVFQRDGKWWLFHTVNTPGADDTVHVLSNAFSPADTVTSHWSQPIGLQYVVPPAEAGAYNRWHATEYLEINAAQDIRYLAAFNDLTTGISYTQMRAASPPYLFTGECPTSVGVNESVGGGRTTLLLLGANPTRSGARFRISSIEPAPRLHVYDVRGHRVRTLQSTSVGSDLYESAWDGRDDRGLAVAAGIYFARVGLENASDIRIVLLK